MEYIQISHNVLLKYDFTNVATFPFYLSVNGMNSLLTQEEAENLYNAFRKIFNNEPNR